MKFTIAIFAAVATLAACETETATVYSCAAAPTVVATYTAEAAELRFPSGERIQLPLIPSEAGERYSNGAVSWYSSGRDALLMRDGKTIRCDALA
ncbi:MAG: MliC family protein [Boseongicola sp.]